MGRWTGRLMVIVAALAAACVLAPGAGAVLVHMKNGHNAGVLLRTNVNAGSVPGHFTKQAAKSSAATTTSTSGDLAYNGGPVLHASAPYLIFWDPAGNTISGSDKTLLARYFADVSADSGKSSNVFGVLRQYTDSTGFANYSQTWTPGQAIDDTDPYPAKSSQCIDSSGIENACLMDTQIQTEVAHLVDTRGLPKGITGSAPIYFVVLPPDVNSCLDSSTCADNVFCAYHSAFTHSSNDVLYANISLIGAAQGTTDGNKGCQFDGNSLVQEPNGNPVTDVATSYMSHEDSETITDPLGSAWFTTTGFGNEVGDNCAFFGSFNPNRGTNPNAWLPILGGTAGSRSLFDQAINGDPYYTQTEWSNGNDTCEARPTAVALAPEFSVDQSGPTVSFDPSASASLAGISSNTWSFGDGSAGFTRGNFAISHSYSHAGTYTVTLTQVDNDGNLSTTTHQVVVGGLPTARIATSGSPVGGGASAFFNGTGSFDQGSTISFYSWSFGDGQAASGATVSHRYSRAGTFTAMLTVTDATGASSSTMATVVVRPSRITRVRVKKSRTVEKLTVAVNGAGTVKLGSRSFTASGPKNITIRVKLNSAQKNRLSIRHVLTLRVKLKYLPAGGKSATKTVVIKLKG